MIAAPQSSSKSFQNEAFLTSSGKAFLGVAARIGAHPGDPFEIEFAADAPAGQRGSEGCTVLSIVPEEIFSFTWNAPPAFAHARKEHTWVVVTFERVSENATRVRLRALGFQEQAATHPAKKREWEQVRAYFAKAWPGLLDALAAHFGAEKERETEAGAK